MFSKSLTTAAIFALLTPITRAQDLQVKSFTSSHGNTMLIPGMRIQVKLVTQNVAGLNARSTAATESGLYMSTDTTISASDQLLAAFTTRSLAAYKSVTNYVLLTMPRDLPSRKVCYLGVFLDHKKRVFEMNESNNTKKILVECGNQDLSANIGTDAASISKGTRVRLTSSVINKGRIPSYEATSAHFLSSNRTITRWDTLLGTFTTPALGVQRARTYTGTYTMGATNHLPQLCYFGVIADYKNLLGESNESNNIAVSNAVRVDGEPDISIVGLVPSTTKPIRGTKVSMRLSLNNRGRQNTKASYVRYWLKAYSGNPYTNRDWNLGSFPIPVLYANNRSRTVTHDITLPAEICGERNWYVHASCHGRTRETTIVPQWPTQTGYYVGQIERDISSSSNFNVYSKRVGPLAPNTHYMFVVGVSGTGPGIDFGGLGKLHLNLDAYSSIGFGIHGTVFRYMLGKQNSWPTQGYMMGGSWVRQWPGRAWFAAVYFDHNGLLGFSKAPSLQMNIRR